MANTLNAVRRRKKGTGFRAPGLCWVRTVLSASTQNSQPPCLMASFHRQEVSPCVPGHTVRKGQHSLLPASPTPRPPPGPCAKHCGCPQKAGLAMFPYIFMDRLSPWCPTSREGEESGHCLPRSSGPMLFFPGFFEVTPAAVTFLELSWVPPICAWTRHRGGH